MVIDSILVPVDGATNIKLEAFDFHTLTPVFSETTGTPADVVDGYMCNRTGEECRWFDTVIADLPESLRRPLVIAPVARGASGGLIDIDGALTEIPGEDVTLSYAHAYPERVEEQFRKLAGSPRAFFLETGSIRNFPGSLTLIKRFLFEEMERPEVLARAVAFAPYGILLSAHFLGNGILQAARKAGNEHGAWMCHTGARNVNVSPGTKSSLCAKIDSYARLVPDTPAVTYSKLGDMSGDMAQRLGLENAPVVTPGGHDTCMSHLPVMSTFYQSFPGMTGKPVIHVDAGSWTMLAFLGGRPVIDQDGFNRDIIVQGTVDGQPVITARYGGGNDYTHVRGLLGERGTDFIHDTDETILERVLREAEAFLVPNIHPVNHGTGPFPDTRGRIIGETTFFADPATSWVVTDITTSFVTSRQIETVACNPDCPVVITGGASRDPWFGRFIATMTGRDVFALFDCEGRAVSETTSLGAAIAGKAAILGKHPYLVQTGGLCLQYERLEPFPERIAALLITYTDTLMMHIEQSRT